MLRRRPVPVCPVWVLLLRLGEAPNVRVVPAGSSTTRLAAGHRWGTDLSFGSGVSDRLLPDRWLRPLLRVDAWPALARGQGSRTLGSLSTHVCRFVLCAVVRTNGWGVVAHRPMHARGERRRIRGELSAPTCPRIMRRTDSQIFVLPSISTSKRSWTKKPGSSQTTRDPGWRIPETKRRAKAGKRTTNISRDGAQLFCVKHSHGLRGLGVVVARA